MSDYEASPDNLSSDTNTCAFELSAPFLPNCLSKVKIMSPNFILFALRQQNKRIPCFSVRPGDTLPIWVSTRQRAAAGWVSWC
jgi:hypothetical protein